MKRVLWLLVVAVSTFCVLPGCGSGTKAPSPDEQKKRLEESQAAMQKGMAAMKAAQSQQAEKTKK